MSFLAVSGLAFLLYLAFAGTVDTFEIVTGLISAITVGILFTDTTFETSPTLRETPVRMVRCVLFVPYLLWEILKANVTIAYLILHPDLPIHPHFERYQTPEAGTLELSTLTTSITLTPGTLVVDIHDDAFEIHVLTDSAWDGLLAGSLERAVGFIYAGRSAFDAPTPRERLNETAADRGSAIDD